MSSPAPSTSYLPADVDYLWLVICGGIACFAMAWGIGANDVANWYESLMIIERYDTIRS